MKQLVSVFVFMVVAFFGKQVLACMPGDVQRGPNCIRTITVEPNKFAAVEGPTKNSWVYRIVNGYPVTVWRGVGEVVGSTPLKLRIHVKFTPKQHEEDEASAPKKVDYLYDIVWDGKAYTIRGFGR